MRYAEHKLLCNTGETYVHNIVKHNERCTTSLLLVSDTDLTDAAISPEEVVQILSGDLIVKILYKKNSISPRW